MLLIHIDEVLENATLDLSGPANSQNVMNSQRPLYKCDLSHLTTEKLEHYFLLLIALDENLKEHKRLREIVKNITKTIRGLNDEAGRDAEAARLLIGEKKSFSLFEEISRSNVNTDADQVHWQE